MPRIEPIPADAVPPEAPTTEDLEATLDSWKGRAEELRASRHQVRATTPKAGLLEALAETDDDYAEALAEVTRLEREIARARRRAGGQAEQPQRRKVKAAAEKNKAGD